MQYYYRDKLKNYLDTTFTQRITRNMSIQLENDYELTYSSFEEPIDEIIIREEKARIRLKELGVDVPILEETNKIQKYTFNKYTDCCICLLNYKIGEKIVELDGCLHSFHENCALLWLEEKRECPICRKKIL
jgi:hypothetical protein